MLNSSYSNPLAPGLYIHIPYCRQACTYCGFYFSTNQRHRPDFIAALRQEMARCAPHWTAPMSTLYVGGGTPSLLGLDELEIITQDVRRHFTLADSAEITLEANPDDISPSYLTGLRQLGITRLSLGLQSSDPSQLAWMNRAHTSGQGWRALEDALNAGFGAVSADLMFGTPGLDTQTFEADVRRVIELGVPHLSAYGLSIEPKTALAHQVSHGSVRLPPDERAIEQYEWLNHLGGSNGYRRYEISNFAQPGAESRHNRLYWQREPTLGLGPSAHSFDGRRRWANVANLQTYCRCLGKGTLPVEGMDALSPLDHVNEIILTSLRTREGLTRRSLERWIDGSSELIATATEQWVESGHLEEMDNGWRLSDSGVHIADRITASLFLQAPSVPAAASK